MDITVGGIPAHPLLVHAAVVFIPMLALVLLIAAFRPVFRKRAGIWLPIASTVVMFISFFTAETGEALEESLPANGLIETHAERADLMTPVMVLLTVLVWVYWVLARRDKDADSTWTKLVFWGVVAVAMGALVLVVLVGDSGAKAVWLSN